ncbi:MAG TPA: hypothetical protein DCY13_20805, partial [Verrucomicrobiales bacterium]|nr:hypothetical protein [Verrucomicrobiales bacterium]
MKKNLLLIAGLAATAMPGFVCSVHADICVVPPPPSGHQAKVSSVIDLHANRAVEPFRTDLSDAGSGYPPGVDLPVTAISSAGSGAKFTARAGGGGSILFVTSQDANGSSHTGAGYADDLTLVIAPPHTNDFGAYLNNAACDTLELQAGTYYQNAVIDRDVIIRGQGIGRTIVSGGLRDSVFKILPGRTVHLQDMTITDGLALNGGGIFNDGSQLVLERVEIKNCRAYGPAGEGGGIYNKGAAVLTLNDCVIHYNAAARNGGGISNSGINTSFLPVAAGSHQRASLTLEQLFTGFIELPGTENLDETNPSSAEQFDLILDQFNTFLGNAVNNIGDIPTLFDSAVGDGFGASGWSGIGSPTTKINRSTIARNKTGIGIANSQTYLLASLPVISGQSYTALGVPIPIISHFELQELHPNDVRLGGWGGGIHNDLGLLMVQDSFIEHNEVHTRLASFGGGISSFLGAVLVTNTTMTFNRSEVTTVLPSGGAIHSFASLVRVTDSKLNNNTVKAGLFMSSGGAIKNTGLSFTELSRCELNNNISGGGGGAANDYLARLNMTDCTIRSNFVSGIIGAEGGGVRNAEGGILNLDNCSVVDNRGEGKAKGGGVFNHCQQVRIGPAEFPIIPIAVTKATVRNCTISGNSLQGTGIAGIPLEARGGGIYNGSFDLGIATVDIFSSTICSNSAVGGVFHTGGGVWNTALASFKLKPLANIPGLSITKVANNLFVGNVPTDVDTSFLPLVSFISSDGYNMDSDGSGRAEASGFATANNHLTPLMNNGGPTPTHALLPGSAAINAGSPDGALDETRAPAADQRGLVRSLGGRRDVGAFETAPPVSFPDAYTTFEDQPLVIPASAGVFANDFGTSLSVSVFHFDQWGSGFMGTDGSLTFTPAPNFNGSFNVPYVANDAFQQGGNTSVCAIVVKPRLDLVAMNPAPNSVVTNRAAPVVLTFDEPVSVGAAAKIVLEGSLGGPMSFTASSAGNVVTLHPSRPFQPGETVSIRVGTNVQSVAGSPVVPAIRRQFFVGVMNGGAVFIPGQNLGAAGANPINYLGANKLVLLDMDRDGDLDIVGTELGNGVWRNGGQGNFTPVGQTLTCPGASTPASGIDVADLNGDGLPDVFLVTDHPLAKNCVWLNNGNGTFSRSPNTIVLKATRSLPGIERFAPAKDVALGDLNGDGHPDAFITASSVFSTGNQVWLNDGRGNFTRSVASGIQFGGNAVRLADLNGDGFLDAVVAYDELAESGFRAVRVWLNDGAGRFASTGQDFGIPRSDLVILGDVNRDGTIDAVITSSTLFSGSTPRVWLNDGTGQFAAGQQLASGHFVSAVMADLNADGSLDLALASEYDDNEVWLNDGNGNFNQSSEYTGNASTGLSAGDVNGDGAVDLLASGFDNQVFINVRRPSAGMPPSFTINENETLRFSLPNTLLSSASSPIGGVLKVVTNQTVQFRNTLGMIWFTFGFDVDPVYEGIWPDGSYVHTYVTRVFANHGTLLLEPDGTFTYQPDPYYFGPDSFTYQVNDGLADSLPVTVNITVNRVPQVPVANRDWYTKFDSTFKVGLGTSFFVERNAGGGVLANDIDFHSEPLTAVLDSPPAHGSLIFNPDGSFRYVPSSPTFTPYPGPPGLDQFTYHVTNGYYASTPTVVSIGYAAPVAFPDEYALVPDQPLVVDAAQGVLANDSDPNLSADPNLKVFAVLRDRPSHGQVQLDASGSFTYTPNPGYTGGDVFTYTAHDSLAGSGLARVKLGNTPPIALDDTDYLTFNGKALTVTAAQGVLANDSDPDGDSITSILVSDVSHGALQLNHDGSFTYTPSSDHSGLDSFTYRASDGRTNSTTRTATIRTANLLGVVSVSPPPNGLNASTNTEVEFTFNSPLVASTIPGRVTVNGSLTGRRAFSTSISGLQLRLHLDVPLLPGELVTVNLEKGIQGANFYDLERAYTSQFQTVAPRGGAIFTRTVAGTTTTNFSRSVVLGDLNADGFPDAFIANRYRLPTLLINNRDRTFAERDESLGLQYPQLHDIAPILADFNGDGLPDLAAAGRVDSIFGLTSAIAVGLNDGTGHFPNTRTLPLNGSSGTVLPNVMLAADCDGDGDVDIVGASFDRAAVWHNDGAGNFTLDESSFAPIPSGMQGGAIGDVNNDGHLDVYLVGFNGDKLLINDGTGQFAASNQILNTNYATQVVLTDLDGDGSLDAVLAAQYPIGNQIWLNDGSGHFRRSLHELTLSTTIALAVGDLNADGNPDLWQANTRDGLGGGGGDSVWTSDGAARFSRFGPLLGTSSSQGVATADLDGDADLDVFVVSDGSESGSPGSGNEVWFNQSVP